MGSRDLFQVFHVDEEDTCSYHVVQVGPQLAECLLDNLETSPALEINVTTANCVTVRSDGSSTGDSDVVSYTNGSREADETLER